MAGANVDSGRAADRTSVPVRFRRVRHSPRPGTCNLRPCQGAGNDVTGPDPRDRRRRGRCWSTRSLANRGQESQAATCNMTGELLATRPGELTMACTRGGH